MPRPAENQPLPRPRNPGGLYRVCCVCLGNICRSSMAEVVLREKGMGRLIPELAAVVAASV